MITNIPIYMVAQSILANKVITLTDTLPNDADLGEAIRLLIKDYKIPKNNPHYEKDTNNN